MRVQNDVVQARFAVVPMQPAAEILQLGNLLRDLNDAILMQERQKGAVAVVKEFSERCKDFCLHEPWV